jgi:hypothetical protein
MKGWLIGVGSIAAVNACVATNAFAAIVLMWTLWNMQHEEALASAESGAHWKGNGSVIMWDLLTARPRVPAVPGPAESRQPAPGEGLRAAVSAHRQHVSAGVAVDAVGAAAVAHEGETVRSKFLVEVAQSHWVTCAGTSSRT